MHPQFLALRFDCMRLDQISSDGLGGFVDHLYIPVSWVNNLKIKQEEVCVAVGGEAGSNLTQHPPDAAQCHPDRRVMSFQGSSAGNMEAWRGNSTPGDLFLTFVQECGIFR